MQAIECAREEAREKGTQQSMIRAIYKRPFVAAIATLGVLTAGVGGFVFGQGLPGGGLDPWTCLDDEHTVVINDCHANDAGNYTFSIDATSNDWTFTIKVWGSGKDPDTDQPDSTTELTNGTNPQVGVSEGDHVRIEDNESVVDNEYGGSGDFGKSNP